MSSKSEPRSVAATVAEVRKLVDKMGGFLAERDSASDVAHRKEELVASGIGECLRSATSARRNRSGAYEFVVEQIRKDLKKEADSTVPPEKAIVKAAFLWLSIWPESGLHKSMKAIADRAYARTSTAIGPYVDAGDLLGLLRSRIWSLRLKYFEKEKALQVGFVTHFLPTVAKNLAIDQVRRWSRHPLVPLSDTIVEHESLEVSLSAKGGLDFPIELDRALDEASEGMPRWLRKAVIDALLSSQDRKKVLETINKRRIAAGDQEWSPGAFAVFLSRFRKRAREAYRRETAEDSGE